MQPNDYSFRLPVDGVTPKPGQDEIEQRVFQVLRQVLSKRGVGISKHSPSATHSTPSTQSDLGGKSLDQSGSGTDGRQYRYIVEEPEPTYELKAENAPKPQPSQEITFKPDDPADALTKGLEDMANALVDILAPPPPTPRLDGPKQAIEQKKELVLRIRPVDNAYELTYQPPTLKPKSPGDGPGA